MSENEKKLSIRDELTDFLLYTAPEGQVKVEVFLHNETIWLPQKKMAELFGVGIPAISKHLDNIYNSGELEKEATLSILETVQQEGSRQVKRNVEFYNLDAIISVGYGEWCIDFTDPDFSEDRRLCIPGTLTLKKRGNSDE